MASTTINAGKGTDLPTLSVFAGGTELGGEFAVLSVVVSRKINKIPTAQLLLQDGSVPDGDFPTGNKAELAPGAEVEIHLGYRDEKDLVFKGIVIKHGIRSQANASSLLAIELKDEAIKMTLGRHNKYYKDVKDSDIIAELTGKHGLEADVEDTAVNHKEMVQYYCTDWDFMLMRAEANGLLVFVNDGEIAVKKPDLGAGPILDLAYGFNIIEFDTEIDARDQYAAILARSWDYSKQEIAEEEATDPKLDPQGNIKNSELADVIGLESLNFQHGGRLEGPELKSWIDSRWMRSQLAKIRGRVRVEGFSAVRPGDIVSLEGLGDRFNGLAFVSGVGHYYGSMAAWYTELEIGLSPKWAAELYDDIHDKPSAGLLAAVNGLQIGVVTAIHDDPDGEDRIQVRVPVIDDADAGIWARVASIDAGAGRGVFFRPEIDDEVVVGFLNDDPRDAVVLGMLHSSAKPAPIAAAEENDEKGIVTRSELKLLFDDGKKIIAIETPNGNKVILSDDEGAIQLEDENGNKLSLNADGITIESAKDIILKAAGDVKVEGVNLEQKASASFKAEGSAGMEINSSATTVVKGSLVQIN